MRYAFVLALTLAAAAHAQPTIDLTGYVAARGVNATGPSSWLEGGFGRLEARGDRDNFTALAHLGVDWHPTHWLDLHASGVARRDPSGFGGDDAGLVEAYADVRKEFSFDELRLRGGFFFLPTSKENRDDNWASPYTIHFSALNTWIGEEVRPVALEATLATDLGNHKLRATAAMMAANDTSGTLLTFRGWALHDTTTLAFRRQPLPPLDADLKDIQAPFTHPLLDLHQGFAHTPGYYAKLSWQPPIPIRLELFRYDNRANPELVNSDMEWGWRTRFSDLGFVADLGSGTEVKAQALRGTTQMGYPVGGRRWVDNRFRSAFVLATHRAGRFGFAGRIEAFDTRNRGSLADDEYDESGWSAMLSGQHDWGPITGLVELLHVSSKRESREDYGVQPRQRQTQLQAEVRMHW